MNRGMTVVLSTAVILVAAAVGAVVLLGPASTDSHAASAGKDVIMMRCSAGPAFAVKAYERSTSSPAKKTENCPEAVALLLQGGYSIQDTGYNDDADNMVITLVR